MMPTRILTFLMVIWSRLGSRPTPPPTTRNLWPGPAAQIMPPLLVGGTIWPGMGPPGRGLLRPPRPVGRWVGRYLSGRRKRKGTHSTTCLHVIKDMACREMATEDT
ncbi:hypothetical protein MC885_007801 [Smutsia gigantea]|nr:hypothetical protein MC885_007801 [Smutsia gigantea]